MDPLQKALELLDQGDVVGMPTETVYGLAARIDRPRGLRRIFEVKERPFFDPLIVHVESIEQAHSLTLPWPEAATILARRFWPGPLTLILPKQAHVDSIITSGLETVGVRCPRHPLAQRLIHEAGVPLAAPSANKFGRTSPTSAEHVRAEFGPQVFVLDGDASEIGIESTVASVIPGIQGTRISVLRAGSVTESAMKAALEEAGVEAHFAESTDRRAAPGQMKHHYMPAIPLIWVEGDWSDDDVTAEANILLNRLPDEVEGVRIRKPKDRLVKPARLELGNDPALAARKLYAELRRLAESGADHLIFPYQDHFAAESWEGVLDRLRKASSLVLRRRPVLRG